MRSGTQSPAPARQCHQAGPFTLLTWALMKSVLSASHVAPPQPARCRPGVHAMAPAACSLMGAGGVPALGLRQLLHTLRPGTPATPTPMGGAVWPVSKQGFHSHSATDFYGVSVVSFFFFNKFIYLFIYFWPRWVFVACCVQAFSSCGKRGLFFIAVRRLLIAVVSLVAEHGL